MKTPREILLSEHGTQKEALDLQRHRFIAELSRAAVPKFAVAQWLATAWRELIVVHRRIWAGLSVVWLIIGALQLAQDPPPALAQAPQPPLPPPGTQEGGDLLYAFGFPAAISRSAALPPAKPKSPGPRSDHRRNRYGFRLELDSAPIDSRRV